MQKNVAYAAGPAHQHPQAEQREVVPQHVPVFSARYFQYRLAISGGVGPQGHAGLRQFSPDAYESAGQCCLSAR